MPGLDQFSEDVLRLCIKYKDQGVVGLDIAGDEEGLDPDAPNMFDPLTIKVLTNHSSSFTYIDQSQLSFYLC